MKIPKAPSVKSYLSVSQFLQDIYQFHRDQRKEFSYQYWANELGISKSYLQFVVAGVRNISPKVSFALTKSLNLSGLDLEYFTALIAYSQLEEGERKTTASRQLMQILRQSTELTEVTRSEALLSNPLHMAIRNILSFSDIDRSISGLAAMLEIAEAQVEHILLRLESAGLVQHEGEQWSATHEHVTIRETLGDSLLIGYHKQILQRATEIDNLPIQLRYFRSLGLALDEDQYREYLKDINEFAVKTYAKFSGTSLQSKRMYQISFNAFPWTSEKFASALKSQTNDEALLTDTLEDVTI